MHLNAGNNPNNRLDANEAAPVGDENTVNADKAHIVEQINEECVRNKKPQKNTDDRQPHHMTENGFNRLINLLIHQDIEYAITNLNQQSRKHNSNSLANDII